MIIDSRYSDCFIRDSCVIIKPVAQTCAKMKNKKLTKQKNQSGPPAQSSDCIQPYCTILFFYSCIYSIYVTGFAKRGLPHTSNLVTLTTRNFRLKKATDLKFGQL